MTDKNDIFENAVFGDMYLTRDGRQALFISKDDHSVYAVIEGTRNIIWLNRTGRRMVIDSDDDLVSKVKEDKPEAKNKNNKSADKKSSEPDKYYKEMPVSPYTYSKDTARKLKHMMGIL